MVSVQKKENKMESIGFYIVENDDYLDMELLVYSLACLSKKGYIYIEFSDDELSKGLDVVSLDRKKIVDKSQLCGELANYYLLLDFGEFLKKEIYRELYYGPIVNIYFLNKKKEVILQWCDVGKRSQIFIDLNISELNVRKFCKNLDIYSYCVELAIN